MDHTRIPELKAKIEACRPDLLVLTGDIFDEFTEPEELDAFCKLFGSRTDVSSRMRTPAAANPRSRSARPG